MKRIIGLLLFYFLFVNLSYAETAGENFIQSTLDRSELLVYVDEDNSATIEDILSGRDLLFSKADKNSFLYSNSSIWTKSTIENGSGDSLILYLINGFSAHDEVDVYLIRGGNIHKKYFFGDTREVSHQEILNQFMNVQIALDKNEAIDIIVRYHSTTPVNIKMNLLSRQAYHSFVYKDLTFWGILIGITLALVVYNLMMFLSLKNKAFLFYVLHSLTALYNTLTGSGHIYASLSSILPLGFLNLTYKLTPSLAVIFMSFFIISFFDLKKNINWLYRLNITNACVFGSLIISLIFFYATDTVIIHNRISSILLPFSLLIMIFSAFIVSYKKLFAGLYFLTGSGVFFIATAVYVLYFSGLVDFGLWAIYAAPFGMIAEVILFSMALSQLLKKIEMERAENAFLVEESNKFNSTGYLLAGILHQFKQPLIYLGSEILNMKVEYFKNGNKNTIENKLLDKMEDHVAGMNEIVNNFYSFYSKESVSSSFKLSDAVGQVLEVLDSSIKAYGIKINTACPNARIRSDEKVLNQVLLIIIENAVTVLKEREVKEPEISISCIVDDCVEINIRDNGGGVESGETEKIFNIHYSKKKSQGLGIGLALAKRFVEDKLCGNIAVRNDSQGACFTLAFPLTV